MASPAVLSLTENYKRKKKKIKKFTLPELLKVSCAKFDQRLSLNFETPFVFLKEFLKFP